MIILEFHKYRLKNTGETIEYLQLTKATFEDVLEAIECLALYTKAPNMILGIKELINQWLDYNYGYVNVIYIKGNVLQICVQKDNKKDFLEAMITKTPVGILPQIELGVLV